MIDALVSSPQIKMLEQTLDFTEKRHEVLLEDIANVSTPGFVQKDMSVEEFQGKLQDAVARRRASANDRFELEGGETFDVSRGCGTRIVAKPREVVNSVGFHD